MSLATLELGRPLGSAPPDVSDVADLDKALLGDQSIKFCAQPDLASVSTPSKSAIPLMFQDFLDQLNLKVESKTLSQLARRSPQPMRVARSRRERELAWVSAHAVELAAYKGQWVVIEGERILAHDPNYKVARAQAIAAGVRVPFIFLIPVEEVPYPSVW